MKKTAKTFKRIVRRDGYEVVEDTPYYKEIELGGYPAHVHRDRDAWAVTMAGLRVGMFSRTAKAAIESATGAIERNRHHLAEAYAMGVARIKALTQ